MRVIAALLLTLSLFSCATAPDAARDVAASPESEEFKIQATVLALYNVISGPAGRRDWNRFEALFAPDARMIVATNKDGVAGTRVMTPKDYIESAKPQFDEEGWFERPVATRILRYGNIAHVWSTYEGRQAANEARASVRGINSFELVRIGSEWKVQLVLWQQEDAANPIPPQFAPR